MVNPFEDMESGLQCVIEDHAFCLRDHKLITLRNSFGTFAARREGSFIFYFLFLLFFFQSRV